MQTVDSIRIAGAPDRVFAVASAVERWPIFLPHYRWVRRGSISPDEGNLVEMAAWRPFGPFRWPTWWVSQMWTDRAGRTVRYRHIRGITRGMDVEWRIRPAANGTEVTIVHAWDGPGWPLIGPLAARIIIGPIFVHGIASRTLAGVKREVEEQ